MFSFLIIGKEVNHMKNFIIGLFAGAFGMTFLIIWLANDKEESFDKLVEVWKSI